MSVLFLTGAGISANAGIPIYRQAGSTWTDKDLEKKSHSSRYGNHLDELWNKHWGPLSVLMENAEPTKAHRTIAEFQRKHPAIVATQNIEELHERAGSDNVAHVHGSMNIKCMRCKKEAETTGWTAGGGAPVCTRCNKSKTRPDVVLFGEMLNKKLFGGLEHFVATEATHVIAVGTSLNVFPAAGLVFDALGKEGKTTIIVNKAPTAFDKWATSVYHDDADEILGRVLDEVDAELSA